MGRILLTIALAVAAAQLLPAQGPQPAWVRRDGFAVRRLYSPADVSRLAAVDAAGLAGKFDPLRMKYVRYLSLANTPGEIRALYYGTAGFLVNSLSREMKIRPLTVAGPDYTLLRVHLDDYAIEPKAWDALAAAEPYFREKVLASNLLVTQVTKTRKVLKDWPGGKDANGDEYPVGTKYYATETYVETASQDVGHPVTKEAIASWLDPEAMKYLVTTLQTTAPILRADWFVANASLPPHYHNLLGLKDRDAAFELAAFDKRLERFTKSKATVVRSGQKARKVARNNRILERVATGFGAIWISHDFKTSTGKQNVITHFLNEESDGNEIIFSLPNGLQAYFLNDAAKKRVDEVPPDIALDGLHQDGRVRNGRSCITCHSQGIQPFDSHFQLQVNPDVLTDLGLNVKNDPEKTLKLAADIRRVFEDPDFESLIRKDNARYAEAVRLAGGRTAPANAAMFLQLYDGYAEVDLDGDALIYESGVADLDVQAAIKMKVDGSNNGVLLQRLMKPPVAIRRDHWEEHYGEFMRRVIAWQAVKKAAGLQPVQP